MKIPFPSGRVLLGVVGLLSGLSVRLAGESADEQLRESIQRGDLPGLEEAISAGAEVRSARYPLLATALGGRDLSLVQPLLKAGADVERTSMGGASPLVVAVSRREVPTEMIQRLLEAGADLGVRDPSGGLVFHALRARRDDIALWLLGKEAPVNRPDAEGRTELMEVAARRDLVSTSSSEALVRALLAAGADARARDLQGRSAGDFAAEQGAVELLALLEPDNPQARDLAALRRKGRELRLAAALRAHAQSKVRWASPPPFDQPGPQHEAIRSLLAEGVNPDAEVPVWVNMRREPASVFNLALIRESSTKEWCGDAEVLRALLGAGASWVSLGKNRGLVLDQLAAQADCLAVALDAGLPINEMFLVESGSEQDIARKGGPFSLLHAAARAGNVPSIELLLARGAALESLDGDGFTPLLVAVQHGREAAYDRLVAAGANIHARTSDGRGRGEFAVQAGHVAWVRTWMEAEDRPDWAGRFPETVGSRFRGAWLRGDGRHPLPLTLREDGMGETPSWPPFAWREIEGGIAVRVMFTHPQIRDLSRPMEFVLLEDEAGGLVLKTENGMPAPGVAGGMIWWRADAPPYDETAATERRIARQVTDEVDAALRRIREGSLDSFHLSGPGLTSLPESLQAERGWRTASVNWNRLRVWPAADGWRELEGLELANQDALEIEPGALRLPKLANLEIRRARLRTLPWQPGDTPALRELKLYDNRLSKLPSGWAQASRLTALIVGANRLRSLPLDLGEAPELTLLSAGENQLTDLPDSLERAPLTTLILSGNRFERLPPVVSRLAALSQLSLENNRLTEFPSAPTSWALLETLELSGNQLSAVPDLAACSRLKRLSLRGNRITSLPDDLSWLPISVRDLDLADNRLERIPDKLIARGFARLSLGGNGISEEEARALELRAEEAFRRLPK